MCGVIAKMPLPPLLDFTNCEDWDAKFQIIHAEFLAVFHRVPMLTLNRRVVTYDNKRDADGIPNGLWHLISQGRGHRLFDAHRAARITWLPSMIDGSADDLHRWRYVEGDGKTRIYLWLKVENYVAIFEETQNQNVLVTAFYISERWKQQDLEKKQAKGIAF